MLDQTRRRRLQASCCCRRSAARVAAAAAAVARVGTAAVQARNLVLITIDTLRADRVGAYGYAGHARRTSTRWRRMAFASTTRSRPRRSRCRRTRR